ncbi:vacuolar-sorting protein SNF7 [Acrasis kona]|uniref:Vacuolar-sorting protein SNF7 n=1 Tax=Acrasis kona TaxID=1008807 RepID=A0AAW2ZQ89_9EUKA
MFGWFTKKKEQKNEETIHNSMNTIRDTIETLEKKERLLEKNCEAEQAKAREFIQEKNRTAAAACLKKKKQYEQQIERLQQQKTNLEAQISQIEQSTLDVEVLKAQQIGAKALKSAHGGLTVEDIEKKVDEFSDTMATANDISRALSQNVSGGEMFDEDELEAELEGLQDQLDADDLGKIQQLTVTKTTITNTADGTKTQVTTKKARKMTEEEEELARMEAELLA